MSPFPIAVLEMSAYLVDPVVRYRAEAQPVMLTGSSPESVAIGDVTGDGVVDRVVS